jgi:NAD+ kinase
MSPNEIKRFGIVSNPQLPEAAELAEAITSYLAQKGDNPITGALSDDSVREAIVADPVDLLIALGGDGTMLRAGHLCAPLNIPILGINLGHFGFLMEVHRQEWQPALDRVIGGDYWLEPHMMLRAELMRAGKSQGTWDVLNECVIGRGKMVRPVRLKAEIDDLYLTTYVADGLIVATPTGSTAYALAAGGPILPPELRNILIVPVAPHLSVDRAIVLHEGSWVEVTVYTDHQATLSVDGQVPVNMQDEDVVRICAGDHSAQFVRLQDKSCFYRNLTSRMHQNPAAAGATE